MSDCSQGWWRRKPASSRISMKQLLAFDAVILRGGITSAAAHLNISQPSVSRLITDLETAIGFPLFRREHKKLVVTPEGAHFWEEISRSFNGLDRLTRFAEDIRLLRAGSLRIAVVPALSFGPLPRAIARLRKNSPRLTVVCEQESSERAMHSVAELDVDVALAIKGAVVAGVVDRATFSADCVCVLPKGHVLCEKEVIELPMLRDVERVALPHYTMVSLQLNKLLLEEGIDPLAGVEALMSSMACSMVAEGLGVGIVDPFTARMFSGSGIDVRPFRPAINFGFRIVHSDKRMPSLIAEQFMSCVIDEFSKDPVVRGSQVLTSPGADLS